MISALFSQFLARFRAHRSDRHVRSDPPAFTRLPPPAPPWPRRRFLQVSALGAGAALTSRTALAASSTSMPARARPTRFPISDHCDGNVFFNPGPPMERSFARLLRWKMRNNAKPWPATVEITPQPPSVAPLGNRIAVTWIGHATFLLRTSHGTFLTDPVWSDRAGPLFVGPKRAHAPGVRFADLPKIDTVLLSHDHYDHCDVATLRRLAERDAPRVIAPLGHRDLLEAARHEADKITELDWWQRFDPATGKISDVAAASVSTTPPPGITLTPARHWSNRLTGPVNGRLWGGFFLQLGGTTVWFAGDTARDEHFFRAIRERLAAPDLALIPIGAYEPRWFMAPMHCNPAEAVEIHRAVGARQSIGMHWGTFQLTDEGRDDPPAALATARAATGVSADEFHVMAPGESRIV